MDASSDCQVILFPLCDRRRVLIDRLRAGRNERDPRREPRIDALIFAWLLELPESIDSSDAAHAVLAVLDQPRWRRSAGDALREGIRQELLAIAERDRLSTHPLDESPPGKPRGAPRSPRGGQRKTRSGRVSRD